MACTKTDAFTSLGSTAAQIASFLFSFFQTQGLSPQTVKSCRFCIAWVLSRTGKVELVHIRIILDIITSLELEKPRPTSVLPQWDLGIVLVALGKPPNEPLWQFVPGPFELACSGQGCCWQSITRNIPPTSSNISGKIKA